MSDSNTTISVPKYWLSEVSKLLDLMAGEGVEMAGCVDPAILITDIAGFLGVAQTSANWVESIERLCRE